MHDVGKYVARDDALMGDTECMSGLYIFHFAKLQSFSAEQAAQAGPARDAKYDAKK